MCGRYFLADKTRMNLDEIFNVAKVVEKAIQKYGAFNPKLEGEVYPTDVVPVIGINKRKQVRAFLMKWGYKPFKDKQKPIINARSESASQKQTFTKGMLSHRCLVPATWYYEWAADNGEKNKYALKSKEQEMFLMAAIYRIESDSELPVFAILTKDANDNISFIHNRMPVIVPKNRWKDWLNINKDADSVIASFETEVEYQMELFK